MSKINTKQLLSGNDSPTYWPRVIAEQSSVAKFGNVSNFPRYVLKAMFVAEDKSFCFHYLPKSSKHSSKNSEDVIYTKDEYKGPPRASKDLWIVNGTVVKVSKDSVYIQDKSKTKKISVNRNGEKIQINGHPLKRLLISNIKNITSKDNTPVNLAPFLRNIENIRILDRKTYEKNVKNKNSFEKALGDKMKGDKMKTKATNQSKDGFVNLAILDADSKKKLEDYWSYLSREYAKALVKKY